MVPALRSRQMTSLLSLPGGPDSPVTTAELTGRLGGGHWLFGHLSGLSPASHLEAAGLGSTPPTLAGRWMDYRKLIKPCHISSRRNCFQDDDFMERPAAELCRSARQHGQTDHEEVQKGAVPQVRTGLSTGTYCMFTFAHFSQLTSADQSWTLVSSSKQDSPLYKKITKIHHAPPLLPPMTFQYLLEAEILHD